MKRIGALLLGSFVFLCALLVAGCTDTTELQRQIDELKASQAEIQALKDEINTLKSQIDTNNSEFQDKLNQATARLAVLEGKINGEPIKYLKEGDTATFVSNGIKLFDIKVIRGTYDGASKNVRFQFQSYNALDDPYSPIQNINGYLYEPNTKTLSGLGKQFEPQEQYPDEFRLNFTTNLNGTFIVFMFSNTNLFAAYEITFLPFV